jgi:hypothetical protein
MNGALIFVAVAWRVIGPDPIGFLTLALLATWFLRDQFAGLFKR